jgi:hypothetical protein
MRTALSWCGDLKIARADGTEIAIKSKPRNALNKDLMNLALAARDWALLRCCGRGGGGGIGIVADLIFTTRHVPVRLVAASG